MEKSWNPESGWISGQLDTIKAKAVKVFNFIVSKGGEIELSDLVKHPSPLQSFSDGEAIEWLKDFAERQEPEEEYQKPCFAVEVNSEGVSKVRVSIKARLCQSYETNGSCKHGIECVQWHVCRGFLEGNCSNTKLCSRSHDLLDEGNIKKAHKNGFTKHNSSSIRKVIAKNLPIICEQYLKEKCWNPSCQNLHLCSGFVKTNCQTECPASLSHELDSLHNKRIFKNFAVPIQYRLCHILLPKGTTVDTEEFSKKPEGKSMHMYAHGKVIKTNNLNSDDELKSDARFSKLSEAHNILSLDNKLHVCDTDNSKTSNSGTNSRHKKTGKPQVFKMGVPDVEVHEQPGLLPTPDQRQRAAEMNRFQAKKSPNPLPPLMRDESNPSRGGRGARGRGARGRGARGRGTGNWRGRGFAQQEHHLYGANSTQPSMHENDIKRGRLRNRKPRRQPNQFKNDPESKSEDHSEFTFVDTSTCTHTEEEDLIDFEVDNDNKLVDVDFESDEMLSQVSHGHMEAMWDLFSQDQLCTNFDISEETDMLQSIGNQEDAETCTSSKSSDGIGNATEKAVFTYIMKEFIGTTTFLKISDCNDLFHPNFKDLEKEKWFREYKSSFLVIENSKGEIEEIKAICLKAKMCLKYMYPGKSDCTNRKCPFFHVCKEYIANGECSKGACCNRNHGFGDSHNRNVASKLFPRQHFTNKQLQCLVRSSTMQVCSDYNKQRCNKGKKCTRVHICENYGHKKCSQHRCKLAHNNGLKTSATKALLKRFHRKEPPDTNSYMFAKSLLVCKGVQELQPDDIQTPKPKAKSAAVTTDFCIQSSALNNHICIKFLLTKCEEGPKCLYHHCSMPYQWVYLVDKQWHMLNEKDNTNLEEKFCRANCTEVLISLTLDCPSSSTEQAHMKNVPFIYKVDLNNMRLAFLDQEELHLPLKRLSTESQVNIPDCPLATKWCWFWAENADRDFVEYQPRPGAKDPTSATIEKHFLEGNSRYVFEVAQHSYKLYFKENPMVQKNMDPKYYTKRVVLRRPQYIGAQEFRKRASASQKIPTADQRQMPHSWKKMSESRDILLVRLKSSTKEFKDMNTLFVGSMGIKQATINFIDRIQNPFMWDKYQRKKNHMVRNAGGQKVDERLLFHGTSNANIRPICKQNFDWRLYGEITGNIYGEGAYFAQNASTSDCYCPEDEDGVKYMFIANVLVGSYTTGQKIFRRPPPKENDASDLYDSCVDEIGIPKIFVLFDVDQYYPGYLVEYKMTSNYRASDFSGPASRPAPIQTTAMPNYPSLPAPQATASSNIVEEAIKSQLEHLTKSSVNKQADKCLVM